MGRRQRNPVNISLYAIADPARAKDRPIDVLAAEAVAGGACLVQYRDKHASGRTLFVRTRAISDALMDSNVPLIVNDRTDIVLAAGASGVHLGQDDLHPADAREILGDRAIIGFSVKTVEEARAAPLDDLDYVFIGGVFETASKDNPTAIGLDGWKERAAIIHQRDPDIPIGAIAGIDRSNIAEVIAAGADGVAVISAIFMADDVEAATRGLGEIIGQARKARR